MASSQSSMGTRSRHKFLLAPAISCLPTLRVILLQRLRPAHVHFSQYLAGSGISRNMGLATTLGVLGLVDPPHTLLALVFFLQRPLEITSMRVYPLCLCHSRKQPAAGIGISDDWAVQVGGTFWQCRQISYSSRRIRANRTLLPLSC